MLYPQFKPALELKRASSCPSLTTLYDRHKTLNPAQNALKTTPYQKRVVLIDWDGCLCDSMNRILKRVEIVGNMLKEIHGEKINISEKKLKTSWTREFNCHLQFVFGEFWEDAAKLYNQNINHPDLPPESAFQGAREFIESIQQSNLPFAIVSNASSEDINEEIKIFGWETLFLNVPIISSDEIKPYVKPDPVHFLQALKQLKVDIDNKEAYEIIVIGDGADSDMLGALKLAQEGFKVKAIWTNHGKIINCNLTSTQSFAEVTPLVLESSIQPRSSLRKRKRN